MAVYQIYKILFNRSRQGNLLSKMDGRSAYDKAQELLEEMLGGVLPLTKGDCKWWKSNEFQCSCRSSYR